jgi:hypothetical protein
MTGRRALDHRARRRTDPARQRDDLLSAPDGGELSPSVTVEEDGDIHFVLGRPVGGRVARQAFRESFRL